MFQSIVTLLQSKDDSFNGENDRRVEYFTANLLTSNGEVVKVSTTKELYEQVKPFGADKVEGTITLELKMAGNKLKAKAISFEPIEK